MALKQKSGSLAAYGQSSLTMLVVLVLFGFFLIASALVTVSGANVYKSVSDGMEYNSTLRSSYAYLANRLRGNESAGAVLVGQLEGSDGYFGEVVSGTEGDMLILTDDYGGDRYYTRVYVYDGWLRESFLWDMTEFHPQDGEKITQVESFYVWKEENLIRYAFDCGDDSQPFIAGACLRTD